MKCEIGFSQEYKSCQSCPSLDGSQSSRTDIRKSSSFLYKVSTSEGRNFHNVVRTDDTSRISLKVQANELRENIFLAKRNIIPQVNHISPESPTSPQNAPPQ